MTRRFHWHPVCPHRSALSSAWAAQTVRHPHPNSDIGRTPRIGFPANTPSWLTSTVCWLHSIKDARSGYGELKNPGKKLPEGTFGVSGGHGAEMKSQSTGWNIINLCNNTEHLVCDRASQAAEGRPPKMRGLCQRYKTSRGSEHDSSQLMKKPNLHFECSDWLGPHPALSLCLINSRTKHGPHTCCGCPTLGSVSGQIKVQLLERRHCLRESCASQALKETQISQCWGENWAADGVGQDARVPQKKQIRDRIHHV